MRPIDIEVMLQTYISPTALGGYYEGVPAYAETYDSLTKHGMIRQIYSQTDVGIVKFECTPKGRFYVEYLLSIPLPEPSYYIPDFRIKEL